MTGKRLRKIIQQLLLMFYTVKKWEYVQRIFQKFNLNREKQIIILIIPNEEKEGWHYFAVK